MPNYYRDCRISIINAMQRKFDTSERTARDQVMDDIFSIMESDMTFFLLQDFDGMSSSNDIIFG